MILYLAVLTLSLVVLTLNLGVLGMMLKLYTEILKDRNMERRMKKEGEDGEK